MSVSRIYRLLRLVTLLQSHRGRSADDLARELEVSRRTVFRDLNMLELAHIPYYFDPETGGYRIGSHFFLPPVSLTLTESLAILMMTGRLRASASLPLAGQAARAAMKVESALPPGIRDHVGSVLDRLHVDLGPVSRHEGLDDMFDELTAAIAHRRVCKLVYISFLEQQQMRLTVHPLRMIFVGRAWYMLAWSVRHKETRTFKLGRIKKLTVTGETFRQQAPQPSRAEGDGERVFGLAWSMIPEGAVYDVRLHFDPKVAGNVAEVQWHPTQQVKWNDDGSIEFGASVDGLGEITWWILGYGDQVEVLKPKALRDRVRAAAERTAARYDRPTD
jgi:predicted DNA-binding transcriptional regulator YafY